MNVYFSNTGCFAVMESFLRFLRLTKSVQTKDISKADIIIAQFCAMSTDCFRLIPKHMAVFQGIKELQPNVKLYIGGCAADVLELKKRYSFIDGVFTKNNMVVDLAQYFGYNPDADKNLPISNRNCVIIQSGCLRNCGFCKKAYLTMPLCSKPIEKILDDTKDAVSKGYHDIVLFAENATEYGIDLDGRPSLMDMLKELVRLEGVASVCLSGLCIDELTLNPELIDYIKNCTKIHKVQIEIQSLIPEVRKNMRLTSSVLDVLGILNAFSKKNIITNIMIGYPGETDSNFEKQLELIENQCLYYSQINIYDDTPRTYGHTLPQVSKVDVDKRTTMLLETIRKARDQKAREIIAKSQNKAIDCIYTSEGKFEAIGYSTMVDVSNAKNCMSGQIIQVKIHSVHKLLDLNDINQTMVLGGKQV